MRSVIADVQRGYFAVGLVLGFGSGLILAELLGWVESGISGGWLNNIFWATFGFLLGMPLWILQARSAEKQRRQDKVEQLARDVEDAYNLVRKNIKTLTRAIDNNRGNLDRIPVAKFGANLRGELVGLLHYTDDEWDQISGLKAYLRKISVLVNESGFPDEKLRIALNRGIADYFFEIWIFTVHKFYLVRDPNTHHGQLTESNFKDEIRSFELLEAYLSEDRKLPKFKLRRE